MCVCVCVCVCACVCVHVCVCVCVCVYVCVCVCVCVCISRPYPVLIGVVNSSSQSQDTETVPLSAPAAHHSQPYSNGERLAPAVLRAQTWQSTRTQNTSRKYVPSSCFSLLGCSSIVSLALWPH